MITPNNKHGKKALCLLIAFIINTHLFSQEKLHIDINTFGIASAHNNIQPHYQHANNWGIIAPLDKSSLFLQPRINYKWIETDKFLLKTGISGVIKNQYEDSFLQEIYLSGNIFRLIDFSFGKEAYTPLSINDTLTVGGFLYNSNARPIPRFTIGFFNYVSVPLTNDYIRIKGGISHGWLNDDRTASLKSNSADNILLHEKWFYLQINTKSIQPHIGLSHSSLMGGTRADGTKVPLDYWASFFAKGSDHVPGDKYNAAGAHEGFWDFGFDTQYGDQKVKIYLQKPFADGSGMNILTLRNKDFKIGTLVDIHGIKWFNKLSFELIRTDYQSGAGIPDPIYPKDHEKSGQIIWLHKVEDYDKFMSDNFGEETSGWTKKDVTSYLETNFNEGHKYGGRDDYNNNGSYYNGWSYHHQNIGFPLYHNNDLVSMYAPNWNTNNTVSFKNTRVKAIHIGMEGLLAEQISYLIKATYTINYGSYGEEYIARYSWEVSDNYLYEGGRSQYYTNLQLKYTPRLMPKLVLNTSLSYDGGQLYNAFGCMFGINYLPFK
ncbi:hypothetical protein [Saccharicrinis aurantiacus]|uniref:hypothetical protein n=1 Tax=Saccharicrinis aurantiacus TaxID=1849719 RepID=UPI000838F0EB|nr:hypothetical protein [Saccharicrinis aurantiacus]